MTRARTLAVLGTALALGITGCTDDAEPTSAEPTESVQATTESPTTTPTTPTTPPSSAPSTSATTQATEETSAPPPANPLQAAQLEPARLPAPPRIRWRSDGVKPGEGQAPASVCQVTGLTAIGAAKLTRQDFTSQAPTVSATQLVAKLPDEQTGQRVHSVLSSWVRDCKKQIRRLGHEPIRVPSGLEPVEVEGAEAGFAVLFYRTDQNSDDEAQIEAQVVVLKGEYLSFLVYREVGQDYNYEPGQSPPELAAPLLASALP